MSKCKGNNSGKKHIILESSQECANTLLGIAYGPIVYFEWSEESTWLSSRSGNSTYVSWTK